jgi:glycosyltransferase involved in cell wall biosynthesis
MGTEKSGGFWSKMKTLLIGHYKENSGWSHAAMNTIFAMQKVGIDIVSRNIALTQYNKNVDHRLIMIENKTLNDIDVLIQNVLPHHIVGTQRFRKNVAYFVGESNTLKYNKWLYYLKLVDEVWVPNETLKNNLEKDGIKIVKKIPYAFDLDYYNTNTTQRIKFGGLEHTFKFYYIGELNDRKNIESIIRCFHSEFEHSEQVSLVLKLKKFGVSPQELRNHVQNICSQIKKELRIHKDIDRYKKEIIITEDFTQDQIKTLHLSCDCFVSPTHGEGWSIPSFEAMCYGKTPICSNEGGPKEFITDLNCGTLVDGVYDICNHSDPAFLDLFTGKELWFHPSQHETKKAMRFYYENRNNINRTTGLKSASKFSYENIGNLIKDAIQ